ncbi:hypothetical protein IWQ60_004217 [Tieghemiomyces parasiticus]|uniref:AB hydrolase-1 domain-containing protein n=1 Tax=Tieghemiomyces parasiticus TaxID=78921 RepID=A0A9W8AE28_9FUNG|nr:hypothetical protein IWQ60_004217 [Tieghemiomyces parasiticus]
MATANLANLPTGSAPAQPPMPFRHYLTTLPGRWPSTEFKTRYAELQLLSKISFFRPNEALGPSRSLDQQNAAGPCSTSSPGLISHAWSRLSPRLRGCFTSDATPVDESTVVAANPQRHMSTVTMGLGSGDDITLLGAATSSQQCPPVSPSDWAARVGPVDIGQRQFLRTVALERGDDSYATTADGQEAAPLVLAHGFGTGLGIFYRNYEPLAVRSGRRVYGIDWLGMGLSTRPRDLPWLEAARQNPDDPVAVADTEDFFVESLERWRATMKIPKMVLLGHSFGGYMAALYAIRHPDRVEKLILASPMGVSEPPKDFLPWVHQLMEGKVTEPFPGFGSPRPLATAWVPGAEVGLANPKYHMLPPQEVQDTIARQAREYVGVNLASTDRPATNPTKEDTIAPADEDPSLADSAEYRHLPRPVINSQQVMMRLVAHTWRSHTSPQWFVRTSGPIGSMLVNRYIGRYEFLPLPERSVLSDYLYHLANRRGSGEYSITVLTHPFAFARFPLVSRLAALRVPTVFMYGETDWMDYRGAETAVRQMPIPTRIVHIANAGHNLMLENPDDFNAYVLQELADDEGATGVTPAS